jgi:transcriptional regulator with XRE-family HTH domain
METVGQKIRNFRKRAGLSQLDLEVEIGAATGSVSRLENGEVNPSKETLIKIIESLDLNLYDAADLFEINIHQDPVEKIIAEVSALISGKHTRQEIYDLTTQKLVKLLNVDYCGFLLWDDKDKSLRLLSVDIPTAIYGFVEKFIGRKILGLIMPSTKAGYEENHYVKSVLENKILETDDFYNHVKPIITPKLSQLVAKYLDFAHGIVLPLSHNGRMLGCIGLMWKKQSVTVGEHKILQAFANQIALALVVAEKEEH